MRALAAWVIFIAALMGEGMVMNPIQVEELKLATLCNAAEDAREMVEYLNRKYTEAHRVWFALQVSEAASPDAKDIKREIMEDAAKVSYQAIRVLGLLESKRDREAGEVA